MHCTIGIQALHFFLRVSGELYRSVVSLGTHIYLFRCGRVHPFDAVAGHLRLSCSSSIVMSMAEIKLAVSGQIQVDEPDGCGAL
jgi:hypothetical protein